MQTAPEPELHSQEVEALAHKIMALTEAETDDPVILSAALWRAVAGRYARMILDSGDDPRLLGYLLVRGALDATDLACRLIERRGAEVEASLG